MTTTTTTPEAPMTATPVPALLANVLAHAVYTEAIANLPATGPAPDDVWAAYEAASRALHRSALAAVDVARPGDTIHTPDGTGTVAEVSPGTMIVTTDGGPAVLDWHDGPSTSAVYVERYESGRGRTFHGWVDAETRRMTQSG